MNNRYDTHGAAFRASLGGMLMLAALASAKVPLTKTGACPELKREPFEMGDNYRGRFLNTNPNGDFTLKTNWGTIQSALAPDQSVNCGSVPTGFKYEMWAHEGETGNIKSLQQFTFDERGRMWAVETFDYPNELKDPFAGADRIVILEDSDGDRVVDKHTVFATGLNIPQGIEVTPVGVVVAMAPHLLLFKDANNDDKADGPAQILYTGFRKGDTHGAIGSLRYHMDNWIYGDCGYNGGSVKGTSQGAVVNFGSGIWRAKLDGSVFEYIAPTAGGNSAAFGFMEDGQIFGSGATGGGNTHSQHGVIPGKAAAQISGYGNSFKPITKDIVQGDQAGGFTAVTDHEFYTARLFPKTYWNRAAFASEGTGHLVNMDFLDRNGSTWVSRRVDANPNMFASTDAWVAPIMTRVGPDGAVWVLDWYTYIYLHNGMGPSGPGAGLISPLRNRTRERIYRVVPADGKVDPILNLSAATPAQLVAALGHSNMLWRLNAQKMILKTTTTAAAKTAMEGLLSSVLTRSWAKDSAGIDGQAVHALWTAQGLGLFASNAATWDPILKGLLLHPSHAVRMNTVKAMPRTAASVAAIKEQGTLNDDDAHVRLWVLIALSQMPEGNPVPMWATYRNLDAWSKDAYTAAGARVTEAATKPAVKPLHPVEPPVALVPGTKVPLRHAGIRFANLGGGAFEPLADGELTAGELTVTDTRGRVVGKAAFDGRRWSSPRLEGLAGSVHLYVFRGQDGQRREGKLGF